MVLHPEEVAPAVNLLLEGNALNQKLSTRSSTRRSSGTSPCPRGRDRGRRRHGDPVRLPLRCSGVHVGLRVPGSGDELG